MDKTRLDKKLDLIIKKYPEIKKVFNHHLILSFSNGKEKAITLKFKGNTFKDVMKDIKDSINPVIESSKYDFYWLKIDLLKDVNDDDLDYVFKNFTKYLEKSYFCDENDIPYEIYCNSINMGRRKIDKLSIQEVQNIIKRSSDFLFKMLGKDGKFIYEFDPLDDTEIDDYNVVRHAGSMWSLIESFSKDDVDAAIKKEKIIKGLKFLKKYLVKKDKDTYYISSLDNKTITIGTLSLYVVALVTYTNKFKDNQFTSLIKKLCNGILSLHNEDGSFIHKLNSKNLSVNRKFVVIYYDGESTLALLKAYGLFKDERYLSAAKKSIKYFMDNDYIEYYDHWISYTINELSNYVNDKEYIEFGLRNVFSNYDLLKNKLEPSHTNFEMLMQCFETYKKYINLGYNKIDGYTIEDLKELILDKSLNLLNYYLYPEIAMYLPNPSKYAYTFSIKKHNFRVRIDDIQHSVMGYICFLKNYDDINK